MSVSIEHNSQTDDVNMRMTTDEFLEMFWVIMGKVSPDKLNNLNTGERSLREAIGKSLDLRNDFENEAHQADIKEAIAEVEKIINQNLGKGE